MASAMPVKAVQAQLKAKKEWTVHNTDVGTQYFHNSRTGSTQWEPPAASWQIKRDAKSGVVSYFNFLTQETTTKQPENLPDVLGDKIKAWAGEDGDGQHEGGGHAQPGRDSTRATMNPFGKRRKVVYTQNYLNMKDGSQVFHPKSPESKDVIITALSKHFLFGKLSEKDMSNVADAMEVRVRLRLCVNGPKNAPLWFPSPVMPHSHNFLFHDYFHTQSPHPTRCSTIPQLLQRA